MRISHLVSGDFKAEFCVDIGGGGSLGAARGPRISHLVSRNVKAEFKLRVAALTPLLPLQLM